ncbi:M3 family oligoendopeptidase [Thermotoga profunda]|uniref:M3 family oligoendopeptidase n=1 Tax=Thermotoga profunda TaxID=1508420 RepID=UPI000596FB2D|nr:M3 family oligoendopeptidase [Thermotoga profunda]
MKFSQFEYKRPNLNTIQSEFKEYVEQLKRANSVEKAKNCVEKINRIREDFSTASSICMIRFCMNTKDEFYKKEKDYFDSANPVMEGLVNDYYKALIDSKFKEELEEVFGEQLFNIANLAVKTFKPEILEDLIQENKLATQYAELVSSAQIQFNGKRLTIPQLRAFMLSPDRSIRRQAAETLYSFFSSNQERSDEIYDQLVKLRTKIAHKLGYGSFTQLGYDRLGRSDYNPKMVNALREAIKKYVVPVVTELRERQTEQLGLDKLKYYDLSIILKEGNPRPKGDEDEIVSKAKKMYQEMSDETAEFFNFMLENELLDLKCRDGKYPGGFCNFVANYRSPFIFANFNGTEHDVEVLTHEAGHAFQVYRSRDFKIPEYHWPTLEACEIHSMSMEFFAWPWMEYFYQDQAEKAKLVHLWGTLNFIPYGTCVDEFQHCVYENPNITPKERRKLWREIEKTYMPEIDYDGNQFLENGGRWHQQGHIFEDPFYYIDYVLAQICAFQFWMRSVNDRENAFKDYVKLCDMGGSLPFTKLLAVAKLSSPFEKRTIESVARYVSNWIHMHSNV